MKDKDILEFLFSFKVGISLIIIGLLIAGFAWEHTDENDDLMEDWKGFEMLGFWIGMCGGFITIIAFFYWIYTGGKNIKEGIETRKEQTRFNREKKAKEKERHLDYEGAIRMWEKLGENKEAARVRKLKAEQGAVKVDQTVVHGDYIDDRDTIVKDSVISRSNIGGGGTSKMQELKELKEMRDSGDISDEEYEKMKREIIG